MYYFFILFILLNPFKTYAGLNLSAIYSESTQIFEIIDQVSKWHEKNWSAYGKYWEDNLKFSSKQREMINQYIELRRKYKVKRDESSKTLIFSNPSKTYDIISHTFYTSKTVDQALTKLKKTMKKEELKFLEKMYIEFKPKLSILVKESLIFKDKIKVIGKMISKEKIKPVFNKAYKFFNLPKFIKGQFSVQYVWAPPSLGVKMEIIGQHILIRKHPVTLESDPDKRELITKLILALSALQTKSQQLNLTTQFYSLCVPPNNTSRFNLVEYPLAIALGVMSMEEKLQKKKFDLFQKWSDDSWVNLFSKMLFPVVKLAMKNRENINGQFIPSAAKMCRDISNVAKNY